MFKSIWEEIVSKPWAVMAGAIIVTVIALFLLPGVVIDSSHIGLISSKNPEVKRFVAFEENFGAQNDLIVVLKGSNEYERRRCVESLADKLKEEKELVTYLFYKIDKEVAAGAFLYRMPDEDLEGIDGWLTSFSESGTTMDLSSPFWPIKTFNDELSAHVDEDDEVPDYINWPLDFLEEYLLTTEKMSAPRDEDQNIAPIAYEGSTAFHQAEGPSAFDAEGYLSSRDGSYKIIAIFPTGDNDDPVFTAMLNTRVKEIATDVLKDFPGVTFGLTGLSAVTAEETAAIKRDMRMSGIIGMVAVTFLMLVFPLLRKFSIPVLLTLGFSVLCTVVFSRFVPGHLNLISSTCIVIILGLGVDYGIHFSTAFAEELERNSYRTAIVNAFMTTAPGVAAGALTTAGVFYLFSFTEFKGFVELGVVAGTGILMCFVSYMIIFPAILMVSEKKLSGIAGRNSVVDIPTAIINFSIRYPYPVIAVFLVMGAASCMLAPRLQFVPAFHSLLPSGSEALKLLNDLQKESDTNWEFTGVHADSLEKLCEKEKQLKELSVVKSVESPCAFAGATDNERADKINRIRSLIKEMMKPGEKVVYGSTISGEVADEAIESLRTLSDNLHELSVSLYLQGVPDISKRADDLRDIVKRIMESNENEVTGSLITAAQNMENSMREMSVATGDSLMSNHDIRRRYVGKNGDYMLYVYAAKPMWNGNFWKEYSSIIRATVPEATGLSFVANEMIYASIRSFEKILLWAPLLFGIILLVKFRNLWLVILSIIPLIVGLILLAGLLAVFHINLNPINLMAFSIIYGFGVDDGIMMTHRYGRMRSVVDATSFSRIGLPVFLTSLTTMACFAALGVSSHQGLRSFGITAAFGAFTTLATSLFLLPSIMKVLEKKSATEISE